MVQMAASAIGTSVNTMAAEIFCDTMTRSPDATSQKR